jgi:valyl-tRNA synthetase
VAVVLAEALETVLKLLHPIMPFITEEIWGHFKPVLESKALQTDASEVLALSEFPRSKERVDNEVLIQFAAVQDVVRAVRNLRLSASVSPKDALECQVLVKEESLATTLEATSELISGLGNLKSFDRVDGAPEKFAVSVLSGMELYVNLAEYMDIPAEIARNEKALEKAMKLVSGLEGKLKNKGFVDNAPEAVVEAEREKLAEAKQKAESIESAINELKNY